MIYTKIDFKKSFTQNPNLSKMKKQIISVLILMCAFTQIFSQVAINADGSLPDNSAILDVKSTTQGLLIPKMSSVQRDAIVSPAQGLLIFQRPNGGCYYNAGSPSSPVWFKISATDPTQPVSQFWDITGNSATDPALNFIGTTDNVPLVFKVNNELSGKIESSYPFNTSFGLQSLNSNLSGSGNVAIGNRTLFSNTSGSENTAIGNQAHYSHKTGGSNTAIGSWALHADTTGSQNTGIGYLALGQNSSGYNNTAIGASALALITTGNNNIAVGVSCGTSGDFSNTISIGNYYYPNGASNQAFIGNTSTGWIGGNVTWSTFSDARIKNNIREDVKGLEFITRLHPVTYHKSIQAMSEITGNKAMEDYPEKYDVEKVKYSGFLAQEVEQAAKDAGYDFSGITIPKNSKDLYSISYEAFVVPLVKAVQELNAENESLKVANENQKATNQELQLEISQLIQRIEKIEGK